MLASPILQGLLQMRYLRGSLKPVSLVLARKPAPCLSRRYIQRHRARTHQACWDRREDLHIGRVYSPRVNRPRRLLFCGQIWPEIPWSCPTVCVWICILITFLTTFLNLKSCTSEKKTPVFRELTPGPFERTYVCPGVRPSCRVASSCAVIFGTPLKKISVVVPLELPSRQVLSLDSILNLFYFWDLISRSFYPA